MPLSEIAIAALHRRGGALIVGTHPSAPLHPPQDVSLLEGERHLSRHQVVKGVTGGLLVGVLEVRCAGFVRLLRPI